MSTLHVRQNVAPVIVVLNKIAFGKTYAVGHATVHVDVVHAYIRDRVILRTGTQNSLNPALPSSEVVQRGR